MSGRVTLLFGMQIMQHSSHFLFALAMANPLLAHAQATCPKDLKWIDATYAERTITRPSQLESAKIEAFSNASVIYVANGGIRSGMIEILPKHRPDSIQLTFGRDQPTPIEFSEASMLVEPPMTSDAWPRMMGPCAVSDGVGIEFDEKDVPTFIEAHSNGIPKFRGVMKRNGLSVSYSMTVGNGEQWQGELNYSRELKSFDLQTDVQGWHVFRANSYVKTLPTGKPVSILSVIEQMRSIEKKK